MRRATGIAAACALLAAAALAPAAALAKDKTAPADHVTYTSWDFADTTAPGGSYTGTQVSGSALTLDQPKIHRSYTDRYAADPTAKTYDEGDWVSPTVSTPFGLTELVSSWKASTPGGSWVEVSVQGVTAAGITSNWYVLGRWADEDTDFHSTSVTGQANELATVYTDTLHTLNGHTFTSYRIKVAEMRPEGTDATPSVRMVGAMASAVPDLSKQPTSLTSMTRTEVLDVPTYSQELHRGDFPEYDGGGEAWCSPTSTSMVVAYWKAGPSPDEYSFVTDQYGADHPDPWVDFTARHVFDYAYDGAGNWPFNTAYAATRGLDGFVTRLRSLREAEQFIKAGIPLVTSISFKSGQLKGAGYKTGGHLMVIVGFTRRGDVVVNDPASHLEPSDAAVRTTYDRAQFERDWLTASGGTVYVIRPAGKALPAAPDEANW